MNQNQSLIIEIRAGTGGAEATLFARDLFEMYSKYCLKMGWLIEVLDENFSELNGYKQVVFKVKGENILSFLKNEGGVHRVQRIPTTEKSNRIHTSTASVAVLPLPSKTQIKISPSDIKMDFYKASGPGGQYVNKRETAVRLTHLPTGLVITSQTSRNLEDNKKAALNILQAKLYEKEVLAQEEKMTQERRNQIKWAQRAEKIRTYNFPQNRITDHRINKSWYNLEKILQGHLDPIIEGLKTTQGL